MKVLILLIALLSVFLSCAHQKHLMPKQSPEHHGIDAGLAPHINDYIARAKARGKVFKRPITGGFKSIDRGDVIGLCTFGDNFREIDIDTPFWKNASFAQQKVLVFHELTHCLCTRGHDYGKGKDYPTNFISKMFNDMKFHIPFKAEIDPGYFPDGCGTSIMTPVIADDECIQIHEVHYMNEMFDRCEPY